MNHSDHEPTEPSPGWPLPVKVCFGVLLSIAAFSIVGGHWVHLAAILPWFLILLCPLMHLFMHGGHDHDNTKGDDDSIQKVTEFRVSQHEQQ
jgi:hypothetical protein